MSIYHDKTTSHPTAFTHSFVSYFLSFLCLTLTTTVHSSAALTGHFQPSFKHQAIRIQQQDVFGFRMSYREAGDPKKPVLILFHGNPTSSYVYRHIIPHLSRDFHVIAPDLLNHGNSQKGYSMQYRDQLHAMTEFIELQGYKDITIFVHDWGGPIGLGYAAQHPENIRAIALMETILPVEQETDLPEGLQALRTPEGQAFGIEVNIFVEQLLIAASPNLTERDKAIYRKPFQDIENRRQTLLWPAQIPVRETTNQDIDIFDHIVSYLETSTVPKLILHVTPGIFFTPDRVIQMQANFNNVTTHDLGVGVHYLQESHTAELREAFLDWYHEVVQE